MKASPLICFLGAILTVTRPASSQEQTDAALHPPGAIVTPLASLAEFAGSNNLALSQIKPGGKNALPQAGDYIAMIVTLFQGSSQQQWLAIVTQDSLTKKEMQSKPLPEQMLYTSTGREMRITNTRTALNVQFVGPFSENGGPVIEKLNRQIRTLHRTLVSTEQLNFGLHRYGRTAMGLSERCTAAGVKMRELYHIGDSHPYPKTSWRRGSGSSI